MFLYFTLILNLMKFISIQKALDKKKGKVSIRGWVYRERGSNKFKFMQIKYK